MSTVTLDSVKRFLRVDHAHDDTLLQELLDSAESRALAFLNADSFAHVAQVFSTYFEDSSTTSSEASPPPDVFTAVKHLVRADYEAEDASEAANIRHLAESMLYPYRMEMGV